MTVCTIVWRNTQLASRYAVGIAGVPGSGKSTAATRVAEQINLLSSSEPRQAAVVVQMDGNITAMTFACGQKQVLLTLKI